MFQIRTSIVAGLLAAVGSGIGKLSFDGETAMTKTLTHALKSECVAAFAGVNSGLEAGASAKAKFTNGIHDEIDEKSGSRDGSESEGACRFVGYTVRGLFALLMLILNGTMLGLYVRAMQEEGSVVATVINMASSFLATGLLGLFLFEEKLKPMWFVGAMCMAFGVYLVAKAAPNSMIDVPEGTATGPVNVNRREKED